LEQIDEDIILKIKSTPNVIGDSIDNYKFRFALQALMDLARAGNKYLADTEPWKLFKQSDKKVRTETILNISIHITASLSILCEPFMPFTAQKLKNMLNIKSSKWSCASDINQIPAGHQLNSPQLLFSRIEDEQIENQINKLKQS